MGAVVCDIGGGTTSMAVYIDGDVWHTMVLPVGGSHITSDIAHGLRLPLSQAEEIKLQYGNAIEADVPDFESFTIRSFGEDSPVSVNRRELAGIIEARVEEIFSLLLQEIKRSGYDGLLPAGMVLTGGTSSLPGIRALASKVMGIPVRIARPEGLLGLTDQLDNAAYSSSVGLLSWALMMSETVISSKQRGVYRNRDWLKWDTIKEWLRRLLP
jgi:cell division protein FtsA